MSASRVRPRSPSCALWDEGALALFERQPDATDLTSGGALALFERQPEGALALFER